MFALSIHGLIIGLQVPDGDRPDTAQLRSDHLSSFMSAPIGAGRLHVRVRPDAEAVEHSHQRRARRLSVDGPARGHHETVSLLTAHPWEGVALHLRH